MPCHQCAQLPYNATLHWSLPRTVQTSRNKCHIPKQSTEGLSLTHVNHNWLFGHERWRGKAKRIARRDTGGVRREGKKRDFFRRGWELGGRGPRGADPAVPLHIEITDQPYRFSFCVTT